jgi:hypothetical protein
VIFIRRLTMFAAFCSLCASAQKLTLDEPHTKSNNVSYLAEPVTIEAGKPGVVDLAFRVADALHINSHTPFASEMIPTTLMVQPVAQVKIGRMQYPAGVKYAFRFAPDEKLSVYTGDFVVTMHVAAMRAGTYALHGLLDYQACDNLQCYPVKTLPITVILTVK